MSDDSRETQRDLPDPVKDCEKSVREDNPDMDRSTAIAICQDLHNQGKLSADAELSDADRLESIQALGLEDDVPDDYLAQLESDREASHTMTVHRGLQTFDGQAVRRIENDDGSVTYQNLAILAPGEWTDAASGETIFYSPEAIKGLADHPDERVMDSSVNVNHEHDDQLKQVGSFDPQSLEADDEGVLYADVTLHGRTQASSDTIELVDLALETDGEQGAGGPSVEIPQEGEVTEFDADRGMQRMVQFNLSGLSIVTHSASMDVGFEEQFQERPVAMSDGSQGRVRVLQAGETTKPNGRHGDNMSDDETEELELSADDLADALASTDDDPKVLEAGDETVTIEVEADSVGAIEDAIGSDDTPDDTPEQELQGDEELEMVAGLLEQFMAEADGDAPASEFVSFVESETDADAEDIQGVLNAHLEASDAESLDETPVSEMMAFVEEQMGGDDGDEDDDNEEEMQEELAEQRETIRELQERLEDLEDQPVPGDPTATVDDGEEETARPGEAMTMQRRNGWLSR